MIVKIERLTDIFQYIGQYDGIIFDLDDTLYLEKDYVRSGYHEIARVLEKFHRQRSGFGIFLKVEKMPLTVF